MVPGAGADGEDERGDIQRGQSAGENAKSNLSQSQLPEVPGR